MSARERCDLCGVRKSPIHDKLCAELTAKRGESAPVKKEKPVLTVGEVLASPSKLAEAEAKIAALEKERGILAAQHKEQIASLKADHDLADDENDAGKLEHLRQMLCDALEAKYDTHEDGYLCELVREIKDKRDEIADDRDKAVENLEEAEKRVAELEAHECPSCDDLLAHLGVSRADWACTENHANRFETLKKMGVIR